MGKVKRLLNSDSLEIEIKYGHMKEQILMPVRKSQYVETRRFDKNEKGDLCLPTIIFIGALHSLMPKEMRSNFRKHSLIRPQQWVPILKDGKPIKHTDVYPLHGDYELNWKWVHFEGGALYSEGLGGKRSDISIKFTIYYIKEFVSADFIKGLLVDLNYLKGYLYGEEFEWPVKSISIK